MGLFFKTHRKHAGGRPHFKAPGKTGSRFHACRIEQMESRQLLSVSPLHIAGTYFEDSNEIDQSSVLQGTSTPVADLFQVSFTGGADGSQLAQLRIDTNNTFFDIAAGGDGAYGSFPLSILSHDGFDIVSSSVVDGGTALILTFSGFAAGEKLVFTIDVDELGNLQPNAVAEGAEFEGATLTATFSAPHMYDLTTPGFIYYDDFDLTGTGLEDALPNNDYDNDAALAYVPTTCSAGPVYTAAANGSITQTPLPISLSGTVFHDLNANNVQETGDLGLVGVTLALYELQGSQYVATGQTATTDGDGNYQFDDLLPGTYKVVETQPNGYLSVGATAGTVDGQTRGVVTTVDILSDIELTGGDDSIHNDYAEVLPASISGYVYADANNNGVFDDGESPIADVWLTLADASGQMISLTAVTDATGYYYFGGLMPGNYSVTEVQPEGYLDGLDAAGTPAGGTAHNPGDLIDGIQLLGGQAGVNYNFGELPPNSLSGYVYVDSNNDGVFDEGEAPIAGVLVTLLAADGTSTGQTAITDGFGFYLFDNLAPGIYGVSETQPEGYLDGKDTVGNAGGAVHNDLLNAIPLSGGVNAKEYNFGELIPASISGQVFVDQNGNNLLDDGETLLGGVTVYLLDASGTPIDSTTTSENGKYFFGDLMPGIYGVEEVQPAGYLEGGDAVGSAGGQLDGYNRILYAQLDAGVDGVAYDFWEIVPAKISGYVFQDGPAITINKGDPTPDIASLRDGQLTPDDVMLSGVLLILCDGSGVPLTDGQGHQITTYTDAYGYYEFNNLRPGVYSVIEVQPENYLPGLDTAGSHGGLVVNRYNAPEAAVLSTLAVDTSGSAIVQIWVNPGDEAVYYNFSEVLISEKPPGGPPPVYPTPPSPWLPLPEPQTPVPYQPVGSAYYLMPETIKQLIFGGGGMPGGYTWHLSVIDAGQPRRMSAGAEFVQSSQSSIFDPVAWAGANIDQGVWILADQDGATIEKVRFGLAGGTPVSGDWDGSGMTKIGVFLDGLWFLDLNGNGVWDQGDLWVKTWQEGRPAGLRRLEQATARPTSASSGPTWIGDMQAIAAEPGLPDMQKPTKLAEGRRMSRPTRSRRPSAIAP